MVQCYHENMVYIWIRHGFGGRLSETPMTNPVEPLEKLATGVWETVRQLFWGKTCNWWVVFRHPFEKYERQLG